MHLQIYIRMNEKSKNPFFEMAKSKSRPQPQLNGSSRTLKGYKLMSKTLNWSNVVKKSKK